MDIKHSFIDNKNNEETKKYKEFFSWLLGRNIDSLHYEYDVAQEKNIFYPSELKLIIDTPEMQRLKKLVQLSMVSVTNDNAYHTRYEHSLGTYDNGLSIYLNNFQDSNWRNSHNSDEAKLQVLASLIELLTHDIGHLTYSHTLESLIGYNGAHEVLGERIIDEKLQNILKQINPSLPQALKDRRSLYSSKGTLKEGNIDLDRLNYLILDINYIDEQSPYIEQVSQRIIDGTSFEIIDGTEVPVFSNNVVPDTQTMLECRRDQIKSFYQSASTKSLDTMCNVLAKSIASDSSLSCISTQNYLRECIKSKTEMDLDVHTKYSDVDILNSFFKVAENTSREDIKGLAIACLPTMKGLTNIVYKIIDFDERVDYPNAKLEDIIPNESDRALFTKVKRYVKGTNLTDQELSVRNALLEKEINGNNVQLYAFESEEEFESIFSKLETLGVSREIINTIIWNKKLKKYSASRTNYAKKADGSIVELTSHPDFQMDMTDEYLRGGFFQKDLLSIYGLDENQIGQVQNIFEETKHRLEKKGKISKRPSTISDKEEAWYR